MKKRYLLALLPVAAAAAAAVPAVKAIRLMKKPVKERNPILEKKYVAALSRLHKNIPDVPSESFGEETSIGNGAFLSEPIEGARFCLGYAKISTLPADILEKPYYIGGTPMIPLNRAEAVEDGLFVRTICLDDGSGRGKTAFAVVDCIGLSNNNVRQVRKKLKEFMADNGIVCVNVVSTHDHSAVDTMGIWGPVHKVYTQNKAVLNGKTGELINSVDEGYMEFLLDTVAESVKKACRDMQPGRLYAARMGNNSRERFSEDDGVLKQGLSDYLWDRRAPQDNSTLLTRLRFVPDEKDVKPTLIVSCAAHPYINSLPIRGKNSGRTISGDFIYYMGETVEKTGSNFLFFNGAVEAIYPHRLYSDRLKNIGQAKAVGTELAMITLSMTKTPEQIAADPFLNPDIYEKSIGIFSGENKSRYALWLEKKGDTVVSEHEVEPLLNIRVCEALIKVDNPIYVLIGKLHIGNFGIYRTPDGAYNSLTEVGYMELGKTLKFAMIPGEMDPSITTGTLVMKGENVWTGEDFPLPSLESIARSDTLCVIGLANDAIGYIIPDNDFLMVFFGSSDKAYKLFGNHYQEIFSFGRKTASTLVKTFMKASGKPIDMNCDIADIIEK